MPRLCSPCRPAILVLSLALAAPWCAAASPAPPGASPAGLSVPASPGPWTALWGWLTAVWAEEGCRIDPNGCAQVIGGNPGVVPLTPPGAPQDEGCRIDPDGCARVTGWTSSVVPPTPSSPADAGCRLDPNGSSCAAGR